MAQLDVPLTEAAIHFNAFALIRRGYKIESITPAECERLRHLLVGLEEPDRAKRAWPGLAPRQRFTEEKRSMFKSVAIYIMSTALYPLVVLQALSYRLIGVEAKWQWGYARAQPVSRPTKNQIRFATTFPHVLIISISGTLVALVQLRLL